MAWPSVYTYNFCSNPSFEQDLTGVTAVNGATFLTDDSTGLYGAQSLIVSTPGQQANEGVILPPGTVLASGTGCVSFYLQGNDVTSSGTLNVYAIDTTSATTLGSTTVSFDPTMEWQRVVINGITLTNAHNIAVYVETASIQITAFNIDAVQYEPSLSLNGGTLPTPYIDGGELFGTWVGGADESASYKLYQNMLSASGSVQFSGEGALLQRGAVFYLVNTDPASGPAQVTGNIDLSGHQFQGLTGLLSGGGTVTVAGTTVALMVSGLDDFAVFSSGDVDPAVSLVGYNNAGVSSGTNTAGSAGYTRPYATFSAPIAFQGSTGKNLWNTAAYFATGYEFGSMATNVAQNVTHVQAELVPNKGTAITPSTYSRPRALTATLAPTEINYCTNPSFETNVTGWTGINSTSPARSTTRAYSGTAAMYLAATTNGGAYTVISNLIVGQTYTAYGWVYNTGSTDNFTISAGVTSNTVSVPNAVWTQLSVTFTATASNMTLAFQVAVANNFYVDAVMVYPGTALLTYADGNTTGWNWESTANNSRSYYYQRGNIAYAAVQNILSDHLPLGLHAYAPVYNSPPTQYS